MAASVTKIAGPGIVGGVGALMLFEVGLDTSFAAGGEAIDLTDYFKYIKSAKVGAVEANADDAYKFGVVVPDPATAVTSSNVLITAYQSNNTVESFDEANTVDLSSVGELRLEVWGLPAVGV